MIKIPLISNKSGPAFIIHSKGKNFRYNILDSCLLKLVKNNYKDCNYLIFINIQQS